MEFHEKLQELRKQKGLTQEELAGALYVSRTAVSKWESGRGYPSIDSLKAIGRFFGITIDDLLSGGELLTLAEEDSRQTEKNLRTIVFGLLDCCSAMLLFLPFFAQRSDGIIQAVSLLALTRISPWLKAAYFILVIGMTLAGMLTLALQNCENRFWIRNKDKLSLLVHALGVILFTICLQPYASAFLFVLLSIKGLMLLKWQ